MEPPHQLLHDLLQYHHHASPVVQDQAHFLLSHAHDSWTDWLSSSTTTTHLLSAASPTALGEPSSSIPPDTSWFPDPNEIKSIPPLESVNMDDLPASSPIEASTIEDPQLLEWVKKYGLDYDGDSETAPDGSFLDWGYKSQLIEQTRRAYVFSRIPRALIIYLLVDFFLVTPGMDVYKDEIAQDQTGFLREFVVENSVRLVILLLVVGATILVSK